MPFLTRIDLGIRDLLKDPKRCHDFFTAITQDDIAGQIRARRKKLGLTQNVFATASGMKQSAVSRIEQAEYSSWSSKTLFRAAFALKARWRIALEPWEDAIKEYEDLESASTTASERRDVSATTESVAEAGMQPATALPEPQSFFLVPNRTTASASAQKLEAPIPISVASEKKGAAKKEEMVSRYLADFYSARPQFADQQRQNPFEVPMR